MCGIVGYIGKKSVLSILLNGLTKLEYRGYDSSGVAIFDKNKINIFKAEGKLQNLKNLLEEKNAHNIFSSVGIGHIRWATHGVPNTTNAHPHQSTCNKIAVVHNGIIENYKELREILTQNGSNFESETDTEVIANLISYEYNKTNDFFKAVKNALPKLQGAFAIVVMCEDYPDMLICAKKNAPLVIGLGEGENFIGSDIPAIIDYTKKAVYLDDNEIATLTCEKVQFFDKNGNLLEKTAEILPWEPVALSKMGFKHFMLKEIHEQPDVIRQTLFGKLVNIDAPIPLNEVSLNKETLKNLEKIEIIACGTSLHAAMAGKFAIEELAEIPVHIEASSEYIYKKNLTTPNTLVIGVSQSGETADTLTAIRQAKQKGAHVLVITNRPDSAMAREADSLLSVNAGIEVSVAATKSYTAQLISFYLLALYVAELKGVVEPQKIRKIKEEMIKLPQKIETILNNKEPIQRCAKAFANFKNFIYIARGINFSVALEGALKLKEISYINATGYSAGELKHGPIAMLDESMPVLAILVKGVVYEKILSNAEEAKARNARLIALTTSQDTLLDELFEYVLRVPEVEEILSPVLTTIPLQLLAYYIAEFLGKDVDQPRNLAKSVTVE